MCSGNMVCAESVRHACACTCAHAARCRKQRRTFPPHSWTKEPDAYAGNAYICANVRSAVRQSLKKPSLLNNGRRGGRNAYAKIAWPRRKAWAAGRARSGGTGRACNVISRSRTRSTACVSRATGGRRKVAAMHVLAPMSQCRRRSPGAIINV